MCHWICSTFLCENARRKKSVLSKKIFLGTKNKDINHPLGNFRQQFLDLGARFMDITRCYFVLISTKKALHGVDLGKTWAHKVEATRQFVLAREQSPAHPSSATLQCTLHAHNTGGFQCWQRSLCSKRFQLSAQKLEQEQKKQKGRGKGRGKEETLPCHSFSLLSSQRSRQTCAETLATQAICSGVGCVGYVNFI